MSGDHDPRSTTRVEALYDAFLARALRGESIDPGELGADAEWLHSLHQLAAAAHRERPLTSAREVLAPEAGLPWAELGGYRLIRRLGEGGMGVVYMAEQAQLGRLVALKVLRPELAASPTSIERFAREARAIARLQHPNIVTVHSFGEDGGVRFFTMDLLPGENLDTLLARQLRERGAPLAVAEVSRIGIQIAEALACAHAAGILHRDVKPANIRVLPDGRAMLLDFGLARDLRASDPTITRDFAGSPAYAAPEQIAPSRGVSPDGRVDVYALAATLYECLVGRPPFGGETVEQVLHQVVHVDPPAPRRLRGDLPRDLEIVLLHGLEKEAARRYPNAASFAADLRAILELRPIAARAAGAWTVFRKGVRRHPRGFALLAGAAVVLLALGIREVLVARRARIEARESVAQVGALLDGVDAGRGTRERAAWHLADLQRLRGERAWTADESARATQLESEIDEFDRRRATVFTRAHDDLRAAQDLDSGVAGLDDAWAHLYFLRWFELRNTEQRAVVEFFRQRVLEHDRSGAWAERLSGQGSWTLTTDPPGADVQLFQFAVLRDVHPEEEPRVVPMRAFGPSERVRPGSMALRIVRGAGDLNDSELILLGADDEWDVDAIRRGGVRARVWDEGVITERELPAGLEVRPTLAPRLTCRDRRAGSTPLADHSLQPAWYVAVVRKSGYETVAIPFHVDHAAEHFASCAALELRLLPTGTTPPGFVRIAAEAYTWGESGCFMQEREVTCREYRAFLEAGADPRMQPESSGWGLRDGRPAFVGGAAQLDEPVVGVSWHAAAAFAAWCDEHWPRPPGHRFALPTPEQWVRAAKGGDSRPYVFGVEFRLEWVRGAQRAPGRPEPVMSHPHDESPWGVFDLCGSAAEWCDDEADSASAPVAGGSWRDHHEAAFRLEERRVDKTACDDAIGFRLVLVPTAARDR